jgi:HlyD family secretion protein
MKIKKKTLLRVGIIAVIVLIIVLAIARKKGIIGTKEVVKVSTEIVKRRGITETVSANGKIQPETEVKISPDVPGEIIELPVKEGDKVSKGQLLAKIKPDIYISDVERMEAALNNAVASLANSKARFLQSKAQFTNTTASYERNEKLWKKEVISASDWDAAKSAYEVAKADVEAAQQTVNSAEYNVKSAQASLKEARDNLTKTTIFSPIDGTVAKLEVEKGERVVGTSQFQGTEMMKVADLNEMEVDADVNENDIVRVHKNDTALIEVDAYLNRKFTGLVTEIANSANTTSTTSTDQVTNFTVKIRIIRESYKDLLINKEPGYSPFRPGMSATVDIMTKKVYNMLSIPVQAVTTRIDTIKKKALMEKEKINAQNNGNEKVKQKQNNDVVQEYVFLYVNGIAKMQKVKTGIQDNSYIEITDGLKEKEEVIVAPYRSVSKDLKNGDKVKKVEMKDLFLK